MNANILVATDNLSYEDWLKYRRQGIGGSDVSSILGINKWVSCIELWLDKTNQKHRSTETNEAMEWGTILEPVIRNHFSVVTGKPVKEVKAILQHPKYHFMLADVDGITSDDNGNSAILEIKTASEYKRDEWADGTPAYYVSQCQHYLCVTGLSKAYVAVLIGGNTFRIFEVDSDTDIQRMLISVEESFWNKVQNVIRRRLEKINRKLGIKHKSPHKLRKTYASILLDNNLDNNLITSLMGHTDISMTEGHYHRDRKDQDKKNALVSNLVEFKAKTYGIKVQ